MQEISLQYAPIVAKPVIHVSQYDVGRQFKFKIYDGATAYTMPVGTTARVEGIKPDGHGFSYDDCVSVTDNIATVTTKLQMTIVAGSVECELRFSDGSDDIGTLNFTLLVEESPVNPDTDISDTEIPAIIELARAQMENAEAWAVGERNGVPVGPTDPTYHNNAKYYSDHAGGVSLDGLTDVDIQSLTNGQYIKYNSTTQKWENTSDVAEKTNTSDFLSLSNYGTQIPDNSDLNSYITPGKYYVSNGTSANTLSNAPTITGGFTMFVLERTNGPQRTQIIYMNNSGACDQYIRNHDTNTHNWSSWQKIAYDSQIQTLVNKTNDIDSVISANGAMNILPNEVVTQTIASGGITVTKNSDGTLTLNGSNNTGSLVGVYPHAFTADEWAPYVGKQLKLSGVPSGLDDVFLAADFDGNTHRDSGAGAIFTATNVPPQVGLYIRTGVTLNNVTFKPMLTLASQPNSDYAHYVPYAKTNRELTGDTSYDDGFITKNTTSPIEANSTTVVKSGKTIIITFAVKFSGTTSGATTVGTLTKYLPSAGPTSIAIANQGIVLIDVTSAGLVRIISPITQGTWVYGQIVYGIK